MQDSPSPKGAGRAHEFSPERDDVNVAHFGGFDATSATAHTGVTGVHLAEEAKTVVSVLGQHVRTIAVEVALHFALGSEWS